MTEPPPTPAPPPEPAAAQLPLNALRGDAGCVVLGIPLAVIAASIYIFDLALRAGSPWPGAIAIFPLAFLGVGVIWVLVRSRG